MSKYLYGFIVLLNHTSILECFKIDYLFLTLNFNVKLYFSSILFICPKLVTIIYFMQLRLRFTYMFTNYLSLLLLLTTQSFFLSWNSFSFVTPINGFPLTQNESQSPSYILQWNGWNHLELRSQSQVY